MEGTTLDAKKLAGVTVGMCVDAIVRTLDHRLPEVTVTGKPSGVLVAAQALWPRAADWMIRTAGPDQFGLAAAENTVCAERERTQRDERTVTVPPYRP